MTGAGDSHNGPVTEEQQTPRPPSPQLFARPAPPSGVTSGHSEGTKEGSARSATEKSDSRFPATGDTRVDEVVAQLPDPRAHRGGPAVGPAVSTDADSAVGETEPALGGGLPDPGPLDEDIAAATAVHRGLQQRLSDLSG